MQVKSFEITGIEAKRFSKPGEKLNNIRIDHNSTVTQIAKVADDVVVADFRFTANYVGLGYIKIEGQVLVQGEVGDVLGEWQRMNSMPPDFANLVHNTVVPNCIPTAMLIARDIRLPPPVPMPRINVQPAAPPKRPGDPSGVEVA
ncbi:MAG TPA: hypothetical protein VEH08_02270 [Methanomassiliicoccales archaeon]|nr:hypothetical protein [Methanomassiliicoccales archaeon]HXZ23541.1 hypothetical protein [Methanomassiliicoccales archaeon]